MNEQFMKVSFTCKLNWKLLYFLRTFKIAIIKISLLSIFAGLGLHTYNHNENNLCMEESTLTYNIMKPVSSRIFGLYPLLIQNS